jgi:hypothetical protein
MFYEQDNEYIIRTQLYLILITTHFLASPFISSLPISLSLHPTQEKILVELQAY